MGHIGANLLPEEYKRKEEEEKKKATQNKRPPSFEMHIPQDQKLGKKQDDEIKKNGEAWLKVEALDVVSNVPKGDFIIRKRSNIAVNDKPIKSESQEVKTLVEDDIAERFWELKKELALALFVAISVFNIGYFGVAYWRGHLHEELRDRLNLVAGLHHEVLAYGEREQIFTSLKESNGKLWSLGEESKINDFYSELHGRLNENSEFISLKRVEDMKVELVMRVAEENIQSEKEAIEAMSTVKSLEEPEEPAGDGWRLIVTLNN